MDTYTKTEIEEALEHVVLEPISTNHAQVNFENFWNRLESQFRVVKRKTTNGAFITYDEDGESIDRTDKISAKSTCSLEESLRIGHSNTYSVERLSDGTTFKVGDTLIHNTDVEKKEIERFTHNDGQIRVHFTDDGEYKDGFDLDLLNKYTHSRPAFKTDDRHQIYLGENYFYVLRDTEVREAVCNSHSGDMVYPTFKEEDNAYEWIEERKPKYSFKDIEKYLYESRIESFPDKSIRISESHFWNKLNK